MAMAGWATRSEEDICLSCHRTMHFTYRVSDDGRSLEGEAPTVKVAWEPDAADATVVWVTLQARCACGMRAGRMVELRATPVAALSATAT
jgi:hypothetical protein